MNQKQAKRLRKKLLEFARKRAANPESVTVEMALDIRSNVTDRQIKRAFKSIARNASHD